MSIFKKVRVLWSAFGSRDVDGEYKEQYWVRELRKRAFDNPESRIKALEDKVKTLEDQIEAMQEVMNIKTETVEATEGGEFMVKGKKRVKVGGKIKIEGIKWDTKLRQSAFDNDFPYTII